MQIELFQQYCYRFLLLSWCCFVLWMVSCSSLFSEQPCFQFNAMMMSDNFVQTDFIMLYRISHIACSSKGPNFLWMCTFPSRRAEEVIENTLLYCNRSRFLCHFCTLKGYLKVVPLCAYDIRVRLYFWYETKITSFTCTTVLVLLSLL